MIIDAAEILETQEPEALEEKEPETNAPQTYSEDIIQPVRTRGGFYSRNICVINLSLSMVVGAVIGAILSDKSIAAFFTAPYINQSGSDFAGVFAASVLDIFMYIGVIFLLGFSAVSLPFAALLPFIKGLGVGFNVALIVTSGSGNMLLQLAQALPYLLASGLCIVIAAKECIGFSYMLFGLVTKGGQQVYFVNPIGARYTRLFVLIAVGALAASALNALLFTIKL